MVDIAFCIFPTLPCNSLYLLADPAFGKNIKEHQRTSKNIKEHQSQKKSKGGTFSPLS